MGEREYMVRGLGYVKEIKDLEQIPLGVGPGGTPILLKDVANITIGPEIRRGLADWNGEGETVGGIVVVRSGADTLSTIAGVKERLAELEADGADHRVLVAILDQGTGEVHQAAAFGPDRQALVDSLGQLLPERNIGRELGRVELGKPTAGVEPVDGG